MYNKILNQINKKIKIKTLGGRSYFWVEKIGNKFQIINSSINIYLVDSSLFQLVFQRYKALKIDDRFKSSQYTDPKWVNCPNRVASVYIAAIIKHFEGNYGNGNTPIGIDNPKNTPKKPIGTNDKDLPEYLIENKNKIINNQDQIINLINKNYSKEIFMDFDVIKEFHKKAMSIK